MTRKPILLVLALALLAGLLLVSPASSIKVYVNPSVQSTNTSPDGSYNEGYAMNDVASRLMTKLTNRGFSARNSGWLSLSGACTDANSWGADIFIALHTNAGGGGWGSGHGSEGFYYQSSGGYHDANGVDITDRSVHKCVSKFSAWGRGYDRGTFADWPYFGYNLYVLKNTNMPATLIEGLFHDNQADVAVLNTTAGKDAYAQAIFEAVCDHYGWNYGTETWDSAWNAQAYTAAMTPGEAEVCWVEYKNTGNTTWSNGGTNPVRLGTSHPQDRSSAFYTSGNWVNASRPTNMDTASCAPNGIARFTFMMTAPATPGTYTEYWRLVAEGKTWFGYDGTWFQITVSNPKGSISGKVTDASGGAAISGATVTLNTGATATTDASGNYSFANLDPGSYTVTAAKTNYNNNSGTASVTAGATATCNIALTRQTGNLVGGITDSATGAALVGATCTLSTGATATTNEVGKYTFTNLNAGDTYTVTASMAGYVSKSSNKTITAGIDNWNSIALLPDTGNIHGTVTNANGGAAISGATVSLNTGASTTTDASGNYAFDSIASGSYTVSASASNFQSGSQSATVTAGSTTTTNLALTPVPGNITGTITESGTGAAISGATVSLNTGASTTTDASGNYTFTDLAAGSYTVSASATNFVAGSSSATVVANQTVTCNIALAPQVGNLVGLIKDSVTGSIIVGANCTISGVGTVQTNSAGKYTFTGLRAGTTYTVTATASGHFSNSAAKAVQAGIDTWNSFNLTPYATVSGTVTSSLGGAVSGATVSVGGLNATTDANGAYSITGLAAGSYTLAVTQSKYLDWSGTVSATAGATTTQNVAMTPVADTIIDNTSADFSASASWATGTYAGYYGTNYRSRTTDPSVEDRATWSLNLPKAGSYAVYAWWVAGTNRSATASYYANYNGGSASVTVNQQANGGSWQYLGTWSFNTSGNSIQLSRISPSGSVVIADAVKLVKQ